jgi:predicted Zn-dependent protease
MSFLRIALGLSLFSFAVILPKWTDAQEPHLSAPQSGSVNGLSQNTSSNQTVVSGKAPANLERLRQVIDRGNGAEALKQLDEIAAQHPETPGVDRLRGLALYSLERFSEADAAFAVALKQDAQDDESRQMRGLTLFRLNKPADAIPLLEAAHNWTAETKVDPSYVLGLCYLETRLYDKARVAFASQYGFPPESAPAYLLAARMLLRREYLPVAKEFASKALVLDSQLPLAHALLGEVAMASGHLDEAIEQFENERLRNPLDGGIYDRLGDAYTRAGDYSKAQQSLQRALLLEPNSTGPYILLGKVLLKKQDPVNAAMYLERAEAMDPGNSMTHSLLGQAYRTLGRTDDASRETLAAQKLQAGSGPKLETIH